MYRNVACNIRVSCLQGEQMDVFVIASKNLPNKRDVTGQNPFVSDVFMRKL